MNMLLSNKLFFFFFGMKNSGEIFIAIQYYGKFENFLIANIYCFLNFEIIF